MKILLLIVVALAMMEPLIATNTIGMTIYVSTRTDGLPGTGTAANPYNGSTEAQFDALMKRVLPNTTINLSAGTFLTDGSDAFSVKSGWTINGTGIGKTVLKLAGHTNTNPKHENLCGNWVTNVTIRNLTCDANYAGYNWTAHQAVGGILLIGSDNTVDHVETINCYGDSSQNIEQFSILLCGNHQQTGLNLTIENCITHQYAVGSTYTNGSMLSGCTDSQILNCLDDGGNHGFAVSDGGSHNKITGCTSTLNTRAGIYSDTGTISDLTIENNNLAASVVPIMFNSAAASDHVKILNNTLKSSNSTRSGETAIGICASGGGNDFQIIGNVFSYVGTLNSGFILNNGEHFTDLDIEDNSSNVGLVGGGGSTKDITDVATTLSGNKFNEPLADLPQTTSESTTTTQNTPADSTTTNSTASNTANAAKSVANSSTPKQALASISKMPAGPARTSLIQATFFQWTRQSPSQAAQYAQSMPPGADRTAAMDTVATQWASSDAAAATDWVTSLPPDTSETQHIFHKVAETWADQATSSGANDPDTTL